MPYFSPFYFATAGADRTARLWSTDRMQPLRLFVGEPGRARWGASSRRPGCQAGAYACPQSQGQMNGGPRGKAESPGSHVEHKWGASWVMWRPLRGKRRLGPGWSPPAGHTSDVDVVRWHPNCHYVATGSADRTGGAPPMPQRSEQHYFTFWASRCGHAAAAGSASLAGWVPLIPAPPSLPPRRCSAAVGCAQRKLLPAVCRAQG